MKLTKKSQLLMSFFLDKKCVDQVHQSEQTDAILERLYYDIHEAHEYVRTLKVRPTLKMTTIQNVKQIPKPKTFPNDSFTKEIRQHIDEHSMTELTYSISLFERKITICFVIEDVNVEMHLDKYSHYVDSMLAWLYIINRYAASTSCAKTLTIYLYFTSLSKVLPESNVHILDENHVNTAFTYTCPTESEIVIFRHEEWFKVFMHETFHNFALDFSDMDNSQCNAIIRRIFHVESEINLFESYAEFWGEIMNACFCSYYETSNKEDVAEFVTRCEVFINFERTYSFFQMVKVLGFMGLQYKNMYTQSETDAILRENMYKEKTNVLSYYVIKLILLAHYPDFMSWCNKHNTSLLQFKRTTSNQLEFCKFIEKKYKSPAMLNGVKCTEKFMKRVFDQRKNKNASKVVGDVELLAKNMRMSICEMG
jgi:hypothetical protein